MAFKRYPVSGSATGSLQSGTGIVGVAGPGVNLLGAGITAGRVFWLRQAWFFNTLASSPRIILADIAVAATGPTGVTAFNATDGIRYILQCLSGATMGYNPVVVDFPPPGLKFSTACSVACDLTTCGVVCAGGLGYEE